MQKKINDRSRIVIQKKALSFFKTILNQFKMNIKIENSEQIFSHQVENEKDIERRIYETDTYPILLPPLNMLGEEWESISETIYEFLIKKNLENNFYVILSSLLQSILEQRHRVITTTDIINNLFFLKQWGFQEAEILALKKELLKFVKSNNIISMEEIKKRKIIQKVREMR